MKVGHTVVSDLAATPRHIPYVVNRDRFQWRRRCHCKPLHLWKFGVPSFSEPTNPASETILRVFSKGYYTIIVIPTKSKQTVSKTEIAKWFCGSGVFSSIYLRIYGHEVRKSLSNPDARLAVAFFTYYLQFI